MRNTELAFHWILNLLEKNKINFRLSGGFSAQLYGTKRELADIDIDYDEEKLPLIMDDIKDYIIYGPEIYKDESWDLHLTTLNYEGQEIDLAGTHNTRIFDINNNIWTNFITDFDNNNIINVFGKDVKVIKKEDLIAYKTKLSREVDIFDINAIK